jgi:gluconokinase
MTGHEPLAVNMPPSGTPVVVVLFGVTGAGKTAVGRRLAQELGWIFCDADSFHSPENVDKMRQGIPLTDVDRWPWLERLRTKIRLCLAAGESAVLACSALKTAYRDYLGEEGGVKFVYLKGDRRLIADRIRRRRDHYMNAELLESQFEALEEPDAGAALVLDVGQEPEALTAAIRRILKLQ